MKEPLIMENPVQEYAWGSFSVIAQLLGQTSPASTPQAELWMGAHPKAPSMVWLRDHWEKLDHLLDLEPIPILGRTVLERFGPRLPFLFKVLAVDQPLSLQAHPDKTMAEQGFARENALGIPLTSAYRSYSDDNHKPELVCALSPFWALCGFRTADQILDLINPVWPDHLRRELAQLAYGKEEEGLQTFFAGLMTMNSESRLDLIAHAVPAAERLADHNPAYEWMVRLHDSYPQDPGIFSPLLLHLVCLAPGEALFLPPGQLHGYLRGTAVELMAGSDNVLRGGLTPKYVDVEELLRVIDFHPQPVKILECSSTGSLERRYPSAADEFALSVIIIPANKALHAEARTPAPEILLCTEGKATIQWAGQDCDPINLPKGKSALVPASVGEYAITGPVCIYKATVNERIFCPAA